MFTFGEGRPGKFWVNLDPAPIRDRLSFRFAGPSGRGLVILREVRLLADPDLRGAKLRKDGFTSLDADGAPGEVITCRFTGVSGTLKINCDPRKGALRVELLDAQRRPIPGYTLNDCTPVTTNGVLWALRRSPSRTMGLGSPSSFQATERLTFQTVWPVFLSRAMWYCTSTPSIVRINRFSNMISDEAGPR